MISLYRYRLGKRKGLLLETAIGWGEIAPLPGFSRETLEEAEQEILSLLPQIARGEPVSPLSASVRFGLFCAQKPLPSRPLSVPLCGLNRTGFPALKVKLGPLPQAIALVKSLPKTILRLDCNRGWTYAQAIEFTRHFDPASIAYLEEPLQNPEELFRFSEETGFPIAVDESLLDKPLSYWRKIPTLRAAVWKPTLLGSLCNDPEIIYSGAYESGVATLHILEAASPHIPVGLDTYPADDLLANPLRRENGHLRWDPPFTLHREKLCLITSVR